jgi:regulatory protein
MTADKETEKAKNAALRLLGGRSYTRRELVGKLRDRGFGGQAIQDALCRLARVGLVDDRTFARNWAQQQMRRRPVGRSRLFRELTRRGVEQTVVDDVLDEIFAEVDPNVVALGLLRSRRHRYEGLDRVKALSRMYGFLVRRGFEGPVSRGASEEMWMEISDHQH